MVKDTTMPKSYKQTDVGVIPVDWSIKKLGDVSKRITTGKLNANAMTLNGDYPFFTCAEEHYWIDKYAFDDEALLVSGNGANVGYIHYYKGKFNAYQRTYVLTDFNEDIWFIKLFMDRNLQERIRTEVNAGNTPYIKMDTLTEMSISIPPTQAEQAAIATALSDTDRLITALDNLIAKKRNIKQGVMQELLTGKRRLPGFSGKWETKTLLEIIDCLDNLRIPLNDNQRLNMKGDYPYCGANGILDFINKYMIDDDIILIAEDGGYFDEYAYRPIAYRMKGKCWINNHAHILKAKESFSQDYIFYSLVHKNILSFLASGTRAKLNKSEMYKIEIDIPVDKKEQDAIAQVLDGIDAEIEQLEQRLAKYRMIKQGMMQELLTGKTRLI